MKETSSIRWRLTLWNCTALTICLALYAGTAILFLKQRLSHQLDQSLHDDFEIAEDMLIRKADGSLSWRGHHDKSQKQEHASLLVWDEHGSLIFQRGTSQPTSFSEDTGFRSFESSQQSLRTFTKEYLLKDQRVIIRTQRSKAPIEREITEMITLFLATSPLAVGIAAIGGLILAGRALKPIQAMTMRARDITADKLSERLPVANPNDELGRLARVFNDTITRLEKSFEELRRFTADASHELRTPLTAIRSVGEVSLSKRRTEDEYREVIGSMLEEADRLASLVSQLLCLARADAHSAKLEVKPLDLGALARELGSFLGALAENKNQELNIEAQEECWVLGDYTLLRQAFVNLIDNAVRHSAPNTQITVHARSAVETIIVEVIDQGPGIAAEHQERIFDRFYRLDKARSRALGGTGLGLAITRWAIEAQGGRVEVESQLRAGSTFRAVLPRAPSQQ